MQTTTASKPPTAFWKTASYRSWMTADTATGIGTTLRGFALPLIAFFISHSLSTAGWLSTYAMILQQVCAIFGGAIVDRHRRRP